MAMTGKTQTYDNIMEALISQSIFLPTELLKNIDEALSANKTEGITTREEFIKDAVTTLLKNLSNKSGQKQLK